MVGCLDKVAACGRPLVCGMGSHEITKVHVGYYTRRFDAKCFPIHHLAFLTTTRKYPDTFKGRADNAAIAAAQYHFTAIA